MAKKRIKSSLTSNVDIQLTPAQRKQAVTDDFNDSIIQDAVERSKKEGPKPTVLLKDEQAIYTTYDRQAETKAYASGNKQSLIPIGVRVGPQYPGGFHWVLTDADYGAVMAGYFCHFCLCRYGEVWQPACSVCGADRDLI